MIVTFSFVMNQVHDVRHPFMTVGFKYIPPEGARRAASSRLSFGVFIMPRKTMTSTVRYVFI